MDWLTLRVLICHLHFEILIGIESAKLVESKKNWPCPCPEQGYMRSFLEFEGDNEVGMWTGYH